MAPESLFHSGKIIALAASLTLSGCTWGTEERQRLDLGVEPLASLLADSAAYRDTIGAYTYYEGLRSMRVRGYGLVVGLGTSTWPTSSARQPEAS